MIYGVLFSKTVIGNAAVLGILLSMFFAARVFGGCCMDTPELADNKPILAEIGLATTVQNYKNISIYDYEQIVIGNLLLIHLIKLYSLSIYPIETLFE